MTTSIHKCNVDNFPFDDLSLANPQGLQGGAYVSKLKLLGNQITLQTPQCSTKNGIIKTDKKIYCDLVFDMDNENVQEFFNSLEDKIKNLIYDKKDIWFHTDMDMDTIDYHWQSILRRYKGSKLLLRCNIKKPNRSKVSMKPSVQIYDEDETLLDLDSITKDKTLIGLVSLNGLKFTSQSFSLDFSLEQAMLLKKREIQRKCLIQIDTQNKDHTMEDISPALSSSSSTHSDNEKEHMVVNVPNVETPKEPISKTQDDDHDNSNNDKKEEHTPSNNNIIETQIDETDDSPTTKLDLSGESSTKEAQPTLVNDENETTVIKEDEGENNLAKTTNSLVKSDGLSEVELSVENDANPLTLKKPNEVYMEIYKEVRRKAIAARKKAVEAYLEVKRIKSLYMLNEIEDSDDDDDILEDLHDDLELSQ